MGAALSSVKSWLASFAVEAGASVAATAVMQAMFKLLPWTERQLSEQQRIQLQAALTRIGSAYGRGQPVMPALHGLVVLLAGNKEGKDSAEDKKRDRELFEITQSLFQTVTHLFGASAVSSQPPASPSSSFSPGGDQKAPSAASQSASQTSAALLKRRFGMDDQRLGQIPVQHHDALVKALTESPTCCITL